MCKFGKNCSDNNADHLIKYSHPKEKCNEKNCHNFSINHLKYYCHKFHPVCFNGFKCNITNDKGFFIFLFFKNLEHIKFFSHPCPFGTSCKFLENKNHCLNYIHIIKEKCNKGDKCDLIMIDPKHIIQYQHPGIKENRYLKKIILIINRMPCKFGMFCLDQNYDHHCKYSHPSYSPSIIEIINLNEKTDFINNKKYLLKNMINYMNDNNIKFDNNSIQDVRKLISNFHPVHRCRMDIFKLVIMNGFLLSRTFMEKIQSGKKIFFFK
jgi:hypothetical protein